MDRVFPLLPLAALGCIGLVGIVRAAMLYARGVQVVVIDRMRTVAEQAFDLTVVLAVLLWSVLVIDFAWPPAPAWLPDWLLQRLVDAMLIKLLGATLLVAGVVLYAAAVMQMGRSWRLGIDRQGRPRSEHVRTESSHDAELVTSGVFGWSRNPIYLSFDATLSGTFAIHGQVVFAVLGFLLIALLHIQVLREERFLAAHYGQQFAQYRRHIGRYATWRFRRPSASPDAR